MITNQFITTVLTGPETPVTTRHPYPGTTVVGGQVFDRADRAAIAWQYHRSTMGSFKGTLWDLIVAADNSNLDRIGLGFPTEVQGYKNWTRGDLAQRLRAAAEEYAKGLTTLTN